MGPITSFVNLYTAINTKAAYRSAMHLFIDCIYGDQRAARRATSEEQARYDTLAEQYISDKERDHLTDLMAFSTAVGKRPPHTAKTYMGAVKEFMANNNIEFSSRELKRVRSKLPKGSTRTIESDMTHETLKSILQHMDIKGRALMLVLASSGMRIGELLQIRISDVNLTSEPGEISIRGEFTKTGEQRVTFISREAIHAVNEWLKVRDSYIESAKNRNAGLIAGGYSKARQDTEDRRLFPMTPENVGKMWGTALTNAGLLTIDEGTGRKQLHVHMLRKFFRSQLAMSCPVDIVECLMGHAGYLTDAYRRIGKPQMAEAYLKNEFRVTIQTPRELQEISNTFENKMQVHSDLIVNLSNENLQLKNQIGSILQEMERVRSLVEFIESDPRFPVLVDQRT